MVRPLVLRKCDSCRFAHCLSRDQIKLFMSKGERISRLVEELTGENGDLAAADIAQHPFYRAYFRCWNEQRYYEAHDILEQLWLKTNSNDGDFFKGLIQAAGAFVHLQKNFEQPSHPKHSRRLPPAVRLFRLAEKNLSIYASPYHAFDVAAFRKMLMHYVDLIVASDYRANPWAPAKAPRLKLL
jgi:Domain of unknown function (DUF309)